jgi:mucin-2
MKSTWMITLYLSSFGLLMSQMARAQACDASVTGLYGYAASQGGTVSTPTSTTTGTTGTGTTGTTGTGTGSSTTTTYSTTQIGLLLGGIAAGDQIADSGVLSFDGAGSIFATAAPTGTAVAKVGTYTINSDCSLSVSLMDPFGTNTSTTQLVGIVLGRGTEIDLMSAASFQSTTGTTTTTTTGTSTTTGTGLVIKLSRLLYHDGCSDSVLKGRYGFVLNPISVQAQTTSTGTGTTTGTTSTSNQPSAVIGYIYFDGIGNIISTAGDIAASSTGQTYSALQFTGTYSVNPDCTGSMTISNSSSTTTTGTSTGTTTTSTGTTSTGTTTTTSTTTSTGNSITLTFVLSPPTTSLVGAATPVLNLSYSTADESGSGYALAE